ncbi:MAG: hypothetical protein WAX69_16405 [Victivallales bacterium]
MMSGCQICEDESCAIAEFFFCESRARRGMIDSAGVIVGIIKLIFAHQIALKGRISFAEIVKPCGIMRPVL